MPHILFEKNDLIKVPSIKNDIEFDFIAKSYNFTKKREKQSIELP